MVSSSSSLTNVRSSWDANRYQQQFGYVWHHGQSLLDLLDPQPGEQIVDMGCGTGQLTAQIAKSGAQVEGVDRDRAMITQAQANYPHLLFQTSSVTDYQRDTPADAIFSNAVLHWVPEAEAAAQAMFNALKPGGRLVVEFGGKGNVETIISALKEVSDRQSFGAWYFPSLMEYAQLLDRVGFQVVFAHHFARPTPLGEDGLSGWLTMFARRWFDDLTDVQWQQLVQAVEAEVPQLYQNGEWVADYVRLRVVAIKPG